MSMSKQALIELDDACRQFRNKVIDAIAALADAPDEGEIAEIIRQSEDQEYNGDSHDALQALRIALRKFATHAPAPLESACAKALQEIEWVHPIRIEFEPYCPSCRWIKPDGHAPDCELDAALKGIPNE